jgi:hypothetical protein
MRNKYNIHNYEDICVVFYRGNDKIKETKICQYDDYMEYANVIINKTQEILKKIFIF